MTPRSSRAPRLLLTIAHYLCLQERERTRHAVTKGVAESAEFAQRAAAHAAKLREEGFAEKQKLAEEKRLSFNQKVCSQVQR